MILPRKRRQNRQQRLVFLDVVRGLTVAFMILVNNNGSEELAYWPLKHADWNGWTPTDLVFPTFLFLVGIAIVFSTASRMARGEAKSALLVHTFRRAAILFALGILIHGFPHYPPATLRIYGVLQSIAVCYLVASILYLWDRRVVTLVSISAICLIGYWILMRWVPVPGLTRTRGAAQIRARGPSISGLSAALATSRWR
jgi:predicted acyltransferase